MKGLICSLLFISAFSAHATENCVSLEAPLYISSNDPLFIHVADMVINHEEDKVTEMTVTSICEKDASTGYQDINLEYNITTNSGRARRCQAQAHYIASPSFGQPDDNGRVTMSGCKNIK